MKVPLLFVTHLLGNRVAGDQSNRCVACDATPVPADNGPEQEFFGKFDDDGYQWPSIFEEANDMLDASLLMYPIAELRRVARDFPGNFSDPEGVLKEPITAKEVEALLVDNAATLKSFFGDKTLTVLDTVMDTIIARQKADVGKHRAPTATLVNFADDNSNDELVYAIGKDDTRKRVTVSFRGSVTNRDWLQDAQIWMEKIPNPIAHVHGQPPLVRIHHGFYGKYSYWLFGSC